MDDQTQPKVAPSAPKSGTRSYYDILGVPSTASSSDINEAYESLAYGQKEVEDKDMEAYHEATKAYQTLSDPNKRRQYDLSGAIEEGEEYDGLDVQSLGGIGRVFGAMISRFGVPLQTTICQDTLKSAQEICSNGGLLGGGSCLDERVDDLVWGWSMEGRVDRQAAKFYRITIDQQHVDNGFIIFCRSLTGKFKLVLFDAEGSVLHVEESLKSRDKSQTETALYFTTAFDTYHLGPPVPNVVREQDIPSVFSTLSSFSKCNLATSAGQYLLCVYGDNFIGRTNYSILAVPTSNSCEEAKEVQSLDTAVLEKKDELAQFQAEYLEAREKFEQASRRLKKEISVVDDLVDRREFAYSSFLVASADAFLPSAESHEDIDHGRERTSSGSLLNSSGSTIKGIIPSGETIASMTSTATSTATAASGWMSSRISLGLNKLMVASGAIPAPETAPEQKSMFEDVKVIDLENDVENQEDTVIENEEVEENEESFQDTVEGANENAGIEQNEDEGGNDNDGIEQNEGPENEGQDFAQNDQIETDDTNAPSPEREDVTPSPENDTLPTTVQSEDEEK